MFLKHQVLHFYALYIIYYSDSGGGGERVLWVLLKGLLTKTVESRTTKKDICSVVDKYDVQIVIYSGETSKSKDDILKNVQVLFYVNVAIHTVIYSPVPSVPPQNKFGITFTSHEQTVIEFVNIRSRTLLEAKW